MPLDYESLTAPFPPDEIERFNRFISPEPNTGCWLWCGPIDGRGYGKFIYRNRAYTASRVSAALAGYDVAGLSVCHHCDTPLCVNPKHLFVGTQKDNIRDMHQKNRAAIGENMPTAKLDNSMVRAIRGLASLGRKQNVMARQYRVAPMTISRIVRNESWKHL